MKTHANPQWLKWVLLLGLGLWVCACGRFAGPAGSGGGDAEPARVRIRWQTETELNTFGYYVYRGDAEDGEFVCLNPDHPLEAAGTTTTPYLYTYYDLDVETGRAYYYRVICKDLDGSEEHVFREQTLRGTAKPLTPEDAELIDARGTMFRDENH